MDTTRASDSSETRSSTSSAAMPAISASSAGRTPWIQRRRSLSDLVTDKPAPKPHRLQRIPRRTSFDGASKVKQDWPGQLFMGYDEDGLHSCSHCQKVTIDLRLVNSEPEAKKKSRLGFKRREQVYHAGDLGVTFAEAKRGAREGCQFFLGLRRENDHDPRTNVEDMAKGRDWYSELPESMLERPIAYSLLESPRSSRDDEPYVSIEFGRNFDDGKSGSFLDCVLFSLKENQVLPSSIRHKQELFTNSASLRQTARDWMSTCNEQHLECSSNSNTFTPLRLLQVCTESKHNTVALVSPEEPVPYTTLSYCWGGDQRFKTTSETIASAQTGLPLEVLPETIQDAIRVTRELGVAYLWVGSLCIVQDDEEEMLDQISQMASIYERSYVTIAATHSSRSSDGFLSTSNPFGLLCKVAVIREDGSTGVVGIGRCSDHMLLEEPVLTRAWTLQETLLSPRILSFECGHAHWYCHIDIRASCMVYQSVLEGIGFDPGLSWFENHPYPRPTLDRMSRLWPQRIKRFPYLRRRKFKRDVGEDAWQATVSRYSDRLLTYDADKLVAISAVAERCAQFGNPGRYMAGIWERDLLRQCTWDAFHSSRRWSYASGSQVPSWSWASVSGGVRWLGSAWFFASGIRASCRVISAEVTLKAEQAPYGDVVAGKLILKGRLKRALWKWEGGVEEGRLAELLDDELLTEGEASMPFQADVLKEEDGRMAVSCLEVVPLHVGKYYWEESYGAMALVFNHDRQTGLYQRVGCCVLEKHIKELEKKEKRALDNWWSKGWKKETVTIV